MRYVITLFAILLFSQLVLADGTISMQTTINPSSFYPGSDGVLNLQITNSGTLGISSVKVRLLSINGPLQAGQIQSSNFGSLAVGSSLTVPVKISVPEETIKGFYNALFEVEICQSTCSTSQYSVAIEVKDPSTDFEASFYSSSGDAVSITIANVGLNKALAVSVVIVPESHFQVLGSTTNFLGNLESGDFTIADFKLASSQTEFNTTIKITYTDLNNNRHTTEKVVGIKLLPATKNEKQSNGSSNLLILGVFVVIIIGGYFWFKRRKK